MPFPMRIQPINLINSLEEPARYEPVKPAAKSRLKRLFERQFLRFSTVEKIAGVEEIAAHCKRENSGDFEPSSVCLENMVQNFIEDEDKTVKCNRNRCNCFNGNCSDSSEGELDSFGDACEILKQDLVTSASACERNLLADISKIVEKNKISKRKDDSCRKIVIDDLIGLGYAASICKSRWEKSPSHPAGEYDYVDAMVEGERLIIDIDFRSEFKIARSTKSYETILQILPCIFVGRAGRLERIIALVSEAAKQSLKKKGMHFPPWRKAEYVKAKWLSPFTRTSPTLDTTSPNSDRETEKEEPLIATSKGRVFSPVETDHDETVFALSESSGEEEMAAAVKKWEPPETIRPKSSHTGVKIVTGLASIIEDKP
ncbi:uncharacterized protein LOC131313198 isoform X1 [Rhododendron vialii]|uniref:uncharacterized protein LOC131313198 isoform X1 n=1 Tax=Rhododendron vialii TaxID=182163 RepID=UPI00265E24AC|nr:uncharacterized protein LOC131313198 isoform X1 [Rhododendron vialii]XP_058197356.1 uncharacterized protein LOC131313198 isoform X1 [Rhododendron vialii]